MFKNFSTLQRVLFCIAISNILMIFGMILLAFRFELDERDFILIASLAGTINFFWVWTLLKKTFTTVETVTNHIQNFTRKKTAIKHGYEPASNFKLKTGGHQKEVQDLVDAFNSLVDEIHVKAEKSSQIIHGENKNGD